MSLKSIEPLSVLSTYQQYISDFLFFPLLILCPAGIADIGLSLRISSVLPVSVQAAHNH